MAALWSMLQTLLIMLGLIFGIVSFATESWSAISFDISSPSTLCTQGSLCFIVPVSVPTTQYSEFESAIQTGIYNATRITVETYTITTTSQQLAQYPNGPVQLVTLFLDSSAKDRATNQRVTGKILTGQLPITWNGKAYTAAPLPSEKPMHIDIDFGLVNECFQYDFPIPEFTTPLTTRICFSKADICTMVDSKQMDSLAAETDAKDVQSDISKICKKMTATVALCAFVVVTLTLVALVVVFPTIRRFSCHLASPQLQAGLVGVAVVVSLCAVIVWATVVVDAESMGKHFQDQLQKTEIGALISAELPQNFNSKLSYSFYLQICTTVFTALALGLTIAGGLRGVACLTRQYPRGATAAEKLQALQTDDDDEDDDRLINNL